MPTLTDLIETHGFDVLAQLDRQADIPFLDGAQFQGDLSVIPLAHRSRHVQVTPDARRVVPGPDGIPVIEAADGGHEHRLFTHQGSCWWTTDVTDDQGLAIGVLTVEPGGRALIAHAEHGYTGIAAAVVILGRQREQADAERLVAD
jgi:hypothetical protein